MTDVPDIPREEMKPLPPKPRPPLELGETIACKPLVTHYSKWDYAAMGLRRTVKVALCGAGAALVIAGAGTMFGAAFLPALQGAGTMVLGGGIAAGGLKVYEEKQKAEGKTANTEKLITAIVTAILALIQGLSKKKGG